MSNEIRDMLFAHAAPAARAAGEIIVDEIKHMEDVLQRSEAAFSEILDGFRRSICSSKARLGALYNASNPLLRLPEEVIVLIVMKTQTKRRSKRMEVVVSHVCRRLRHVALSTSTLWTKVSSMDLVMSDRMEAYLTRSNGRLLDVDLAISEAYKGSRQSFWLVMTKFCSYGPVWRSFKFSYQRSHPLQGLCSDDWYDHRDHPFPFLKEVHEVPNLQRLELYLHSRPFPLPPPTDPQPLFRHGAPSLSALVLLTWDCDSLWLIPTLSNLTSLTIGSSRTSTQNENEFYPQAPIPIIQLLLSLPMMRQFALLYKMDNLLYPPRLDMTPPPQSCGRYSQLHSMRVPVQVLPHLFSIPQQVFEEMIHLFIDVSVPDQSFFRELTEASLDIPVNGIFPKLDYLTLCCADMEVEFPSEGTDVLMCMTSKISHLVVLGVVYDMMEDMLDRYTEECSPGVNWPNLVDVYLDEVHWVPAEDLHQWCLLRRRLQSGFTLKVPYGLIEGSVLTDDERRVKDLFLKSGVMKEVDGPSIPEADMIWLSNP